MSWILPAPGYGQQYSAQADSLIRELKNNKTDTQKVAILLSIVPELRCTDSATKIQYASEALKIAHEIQWNRGIIEANIHLGNIHYSCLNDYKGALSYYMKADTVCQRENDTKNEIRVLNYIAAIYQKLGLYKSAIENYRQILSINKDPYDEMGVLGNLGVEYNNIGDYNEALKYYYSSLKLLDQIQKARKDNEVPDTTQMAGLLLNIGDVYMELMQPDKAFINYDSVYKIGLSISNKTLGVIGLMGMGEVFLLKKNYPEAINYFRNALNTCVELKDMNGATKAMNKLANAYLGNSQPDSAMFFAQGSLRLAEEKHADEQLPTVYITLGRIYAQRKDYTNAVNYLVKAKEIAEKTGALNDEKDAWYALVNTYKLTGKAGLALEAYEHYITIRDSVYNVAKANEITRQELDFNYKQKQQADKLEYDKQIARQQIFIYGGTMVLVLVVLLTFFIYRNYNTQKKYNELLSKEQQRHLNLIEAQDTVLSDIAHIQAHHVRGPVATILGLVQIFNKEDPADPVNKEIIDGLQEVTLKLDTVVKEVIIRENKLKSEQGMDIKGKNTPGKPV